MLEKDKTQGLIFNIQRFCVDDGPGIRTTVFLKGCPLKCAWCHNKEGLSLNKSIEIDPVSCTLCGQCIRTCKQGCHQIVQGDGKLIHQMDLATCLNCHACLRSCPNHAIKICGREVGAAEVIKQVLADTQFYEASGGGMTLSGGEPLWQSEFARSLLMEAKKVGLHTCVETSGGVPTSSIEKVAPYVDCFLFDIKETNEENHKKYIGISYKQILDNLKKLDVLDKTILIRCPIIPGVNDRKDHFDALVELYHSLRNVIGIQLMPYHQLGEAKKVRYGIKDEDNRFRVPSEQEASQWNTYIQTKIKEVGKDDQ